MSPTILAGPEIPTVAPHPFPDLRARLGSVHTAQPTVVSAYIRLGVADRNRYAYRVAIRDAVRRAREALAVMALDHAAREGMLRDLARIEGYVLREGSKVSAPGLVLFACEGEELFAPVLLPRVHRTTVLLGERPRLAEAMGAADAFGRIITVLVDRTRARFFEVTAFEVRELSALDLEATRGGKFHSDRADSPGWGERDYHQRIREERHRGAAAIRHRLEAVVRAGPCQGIVLAGSGRVVGDLRRFLPRALGQLVMGEAHVHPARTTPGEVRTATLAVRAAWERSHEGAVLDDFEAGLGTGWTVDGVRPTLRALFRGQLRTLLVPAGQGGAGFRCAASGRLGIAKVDCRGEGEPVPVPDLVSEAVEEALSQRVEVEVIDDEELKGRVDGLGGMLRFRG